MQNENNLKLNKGDYRILILNVEVDLQILYMQSRSALDENHYKKINSVISSKKTLIEKLEASFRNAPSANQQEKK